MAVILLEIGILYRHERSCHLLFLMLSERETKGSFPITDALSSERYFQIQRFRRIRRRSARYAPSQSGKDILASRTIDIRTSGNASHVTMSTVNVNLTKLDDFSFATIGERDFVFSIHE